MRDRRVLSLAFLLFACACGPAGQSVERVEGDLGVDGRYFTQLQVIAWSEAGRQELGVAPVEDGRFTVELTAAAVREDLLSPFGRPQSSACRLQEDGSSAVRTALLILGTPQGAIGLGLYTPEDPLSRGKDVQFVYADRNAHVQYTNTCEASKVIEDVQVDFVHGWNVVVTESRNDADANLLRQIRTGAIPAGASWAVPQPG
jgi:hypothetical protein